MNANIGAAQVQTPSMLDMDFDESHQQESAGQVDGEPCQMGMKRQLVTQKPW
ncbi:hypothetical protein QU481_01950 [Crenobacter sp. SG2303]|uniref:Uncharacterized protein n=1 Tax=Crenobacter oryzisoli TaxID=3056844 RepID=A0ABT7XIN9_9NEIS|nr:hypothetical protein [Crenobacter sp. SG2303]MDN0073657.1 hypothetical protein [Crenobacter sp. SG2303]